MRALPVLVALLLVLSPLAAGAVAPAPDQASRPVVDSIDGTTSYLAIPDDQVRTSSVQVVRFDVGGSVAAGTGRIQAAAAVETFEARYRNAEDKRRVLERELNRLANVTQDLRQRQVTVTRRYNEGAIGPRQYLAELAVITARAEAYSDLTRVIDEEAPPALSTTPGRLEHELSALSGPVRSRLVDTLRGNPGAPGRYYVETSPSGVVLATIDDGRYYREAYLNDARTGPGGWTDLSQAQAAFSNTFYPWAVDNAGDFGLYGNGDIYRFRTTHSHGSIFAFGDADSGQVFAEFQTKTLENAPVAVAGANETESVVVQVALTHPGGQLRVHAYDPDTEDPVNAAVLVNGDRVGRTGADGTMYGLTPRGRVNTSVMVDGRPVTVVTGNRP